MVESKKSAAGPTHGSDVSSSRDDRGSALGDERAMADLSSVFVFWPPRVVRETDPFAFGVGIGGRGSADDVLNPYVPREVDEHLDVALDRGDRTVLLIADPGSGAKRTAFEALLRRRAGSPLLIPRTPLPEDPETLFHEAVATYGSPVLWLADAAPMLVEPAASLPRRLPDGDWTVIGLLRPESVERLWSSDLDEVWTQIHVPKQLSEAEWAAARRLYPDVELPRGVAAGELGDLTAGAPSTAASTSPARGPVDHVYTLSDAPAPVDLLGRKPLAESLAIRLRTMRSQAEDPATSFLLHIDGPWGAGKSSLLNYLRDELQTDSLVVDVNAWREQRVGPPWLALLMALRRAALQRYGWTFKGRELGARLRAVGPGLVAMFLVTVTVTAGLVVWTAAGDLNVIGLGDAAKSIAAIIALGATVWTITAGLGRGLLPGSPRQAHKYVETHADPMQKVADHFEKLLELVRDPVVFFIDDLDRCAEENVVEFLEAVQTLLREEPARHRQPRRGRSRRTVPRVAPYFVVAADGRWIRASYERAYAAFADDVSYPGRPLGYLFLEKAFQLTTTLPAIDPERRQEYMDYLLRLEQSADALVEHDADLRRVEEALSGAHTEDEILDRIEHHREDTPSFRYALLGQAVKHMARPDVGERLEHALRDYAELLDTNPRAMKRFVNAYGVERALRTIERRHPPLDRLARWTIVLLRWPELADFLRNDPPAVDLIGSPVRGAIADDVKKLFTDPDVIRVVKGTDPGHGEPLDAVAIRDCAGLPPVA